MPTEDIAELNKVQERLRQEKMMQGQNGKRVTQDSQRKLLIKLIAGVVMGIVILVILLILINSSKEEREIHHTVSSIYNYLCRCFAGYCLFCIDIRRNHPIPIQNLGR